MRYVIIGAGAVGATIGARLSLSGHEVALVARGAHHAALRDHGLRFATPDGEATLRLPVVSQPDELTLRADDVLVLTVKSQDTVAALDAWAGQPVDGARPAASALPVVCAQNGVASQRMALRRFRRVYGMGVWLPATHTEPGRVLAHCAPVTGYLPIGRYPAGADATAERIAADLTASGFVAPVTADVMRWKYGKLLNNLANAVQALCGDGDATAAAAAGLRRRARDEGETVLKAAGIGHTTAAEQHAAIDHLLTERQVGSAPRGGGSSWQSLYRGTGSIEADYLNGEIVLLGREYGQPTPVNEVLRMLANQFARERRPPGSMPPAELTALIDAPDPKGGWS